MTIDKFEEKELPQENQPVKVVVYNHEGHEDVVETKHSCAKHLSNQLNENRYYVKIENAVLADPSMPEFFRRKKTDIKWIRVTFACFDTYVKFLRTKNRNHLRHAERLI